jgi:hypothetical protein
MQTKKIELPGQYLLDSIDLHEISDAFNHLIGSWTNAKLPKIYDRWDWNSISLNENDAIILANIVKGLDLKLISNGSIFELKIRKSKTLEKNEISFL